MMILNSCNNCISFHFPAPRQTRSVWDVGSLEPEKEDKKEWVELCIWQPVPPDCSRPKLQWRCPFPGFPLHFHFSCTAVFYPLSNELEQRPWLWWLLQHNLGETFWYISVSSALQGHSLLFSQLLLTFYAQTASSNKHHYILDRNEQ